MVFSSVIYELNTFDYLGVIVPFFLPAQTVSSVCRLGDGNINDTYLVEFSNRSPVVLQRINGEVFPEPARVVENSWLVTEHIRCKQFESGNKPGMTIFRVIPATSGKVYHLDADRHVWRMIDYVANTAGYAGVQSEHQAYEGGKLLGKFHFLLSDLQPELLSNPLPGFHHLPACCRNYQNSKQRTRQKGSSDLSFCCREAEKRLAEAALLEIALMEGRVRRRVIHGDPKIDNMLFDRHSGKAVTMIDLDTVASGLLQYDLGDCLRSFCNTGSEQPDNFENVSFELDICKMVLTGYCDSGVYLPASERSLIYQGVRLLTYELALRFLTDYLDGNRYFKVVDDEENLRRALVQFRLLSSIENQRQAIELIAADC